MIKFILCIFLALPINSIVHTMDSISNVQENTVSKDIQNIAKRLSKIENANERLDIISKYFLTRPYGNSTIPSNEFIKLNETNDVEAKNRYKVSSFLANKFTLIFPKQNFSSFDCMTYVESVLAISKIDQDILSDNGINDAELERIFQLKLNEIRFKDGIPTFPQRNHFVDLDWVPNNNFLEDISERVALVPAYTYETNINRLNWMLYQKDLLENPSYENYTIDEKRALLKEDIIAFAIKYEQDMGLFQDNISVNIPYITLEEYFLNKDKIEESMPDFGILNIVRPNWDLTNAAGTHMNISHQGFVIKKDGNVYFRHASTSGLKQVTELLLIDYLGQFKTSPTIKGFNLLIVK